MSAPKSPPQVQKTKPGTKPKRKDLAPWKDEGEFKEFYRVLIEALPIVANSHSPQGLAQTIKDAQAITNELLPDEDTWECDLSELREAGRAWSRERSLRAPRSGPRSASESWSRSGCFADRT